MNKDKDYKGVSTVMPVLLDPLRIGFIIHDKVPKLVAVGGRIELDDGVLIEGLRYFSAEYCAKREMFEETGIVISVKNLHYFCSLTLPESFKSLPTFSFYYIFDAKPESEDLVFLTEERIKTEPNFMDGMKTEALLLIKKLKETEKDG